MQKTTSQTTTASTDTAKKGKKKNVAAADTIDAEPNNVSFILYSIIIIHSALRPI